MKDFILVFLNPKVAIKSKSWIVDLLVLVLVTYFLENLLHLVSPYSLAVQPSLHTKVFNFADSLILLVGLFWITYLFRDFPQRLSIALKCLLPAIVWKYILIIVFTFFSKLLPQQSLAISHGSVVLWIGFISGLASLIGVGTVAAGLKNELDK